MQEDYEIYYAGYIDFAFGKDKSSKYKGEDLDQYLLGQERARIEVERDGR